MTEPPALMLPGVPACQRCSDSLRRVSVSTRGIRSFGPVCSRPQPLRVGQPLWCPLSGSLGGLCGPRCGLPGGWCFTGLCGLSAGLCGFAGGFADVAARCGLSRWLRLPTAWSGCSTSPMRSSSQWGSGLESPAFGLASASVAMPAMAIATNVAVTNPAIRSVVRSGFFGAACEGMCISGSA
jgi:hypothetical protein